MRARHPNIVSLHSHDTGRCVERAIPPEEADDPLRHGRVLPPDGASINARHQRSPREPTFPFEGGAGI